MSKHKNGAVRKRMARYVSRHSVECRLERYTTGHERLARQAVTKVRLAQYVAGPRMNDSRPVQSHSAPA
ncbi:MAG: hypothetical protein PVF45_08630 [Anaerolineae bacterium]|jgi:hypothetical protein